MKITHNKFDVDRSESSGTKEWASHNLNICSGCSNACIYCYAAQMAERFKRRTRSDWSREELTPNAALTRYPAKNGLVMFPSTHDITPYNLEASIRVLKIVLASGNDVLIVTKPRLDIIKRLCEEFITRQELIEFRFTIGTLSPRISKFWEPGAPLPVERIAALKHAHASGYSTSVSMEPLLGGFDTAQSVLAAVRDFVTGKIWIGKLNRIRSNVDVSTTRNMRMVQALESLQTDQKILQIHSAFRDDPKIRWKDSIRKVVTKHTA